MSQAAIEQDMTDTPRPIAGEATPEDVQAEPSLRPRSLAEYIGQTKITSNLKIFLKAALARREALDHVLFCGPPGLGKTTLANIIAAEMGAALKSVSAPAIERGGDLAALLTNLQEGEVLFIDEIHRLKPQIEEVLYPAMEDYQLDLMIGQGTAARSIKLELPKFTLVGATTRAGMLTAPGFLPATGFGGHHSPLGGDSECGDRSHRRERDCAARARHTAYRQSPASARAR